uniref:response regulator transcription factor n=1 Tax=Anaerosporobacter sp. TaxID=1872529 RepID=UPI0028979144
MKKENKNILIVDDEPKILEVVSSFLENKGYSTFTAENGQQALKVFEQENIALVVLDLMMPGISGEEVCLAIRKQSRVPIIMLTAKADEDNLLQGLRLGADDYIRKPFSLKELHARIETVLRRSGDDLTPLTVKN